MCHGTIISSSHERKLAYCFSLGDGVWAIGTSRGEANLLSLASFVIVEAMRAGMSPKDAGMSALKRVAANTVEKRLLNESGTPNFNVAYYIVNVKGEYAGVSLYGSSGRGRVRYAVCTEDGPRTEETEALFEGAPAGG